ncbi:protein LEAD-SENSITIVE 1-like [Amaranthus tricolor]|uniref:protein LEAD-SENSITIVE 1-like n=1 Tax=Amaranthus tricolor TaxID=29722 RepID=UPI00258DE108|nr:protein LEAD-SENSITIVE 1-like [Amaranthus tricolor]
MLPKIRGETPISKDDLKPRDHIYTYRTGYIYCHHGIYEGNGRIIHFTGDMLGGNSLSSFSSSSSHHKKCSNCGYQSNVMGVIRTCFDCFLHEFKNLYLYVYGKCDPPEEVLSCARFLLQKYKGFGDYSLTENNCEDFAIYCKTGCLLFDQNGKHVSRSTQVRKAGLVIDGVTSAISPLGAVLKLLKNSKYTERRISVEVFYDKYHYKA